MNIQRILKAFWFSNLFMLACLFVVVLFVMFSPNPWSTNGHVASFLITTIQHLISWPFGLYNSIFPNNQCIADNAHIIDGQDLCGLSLLAWLAAITTISALYTFIFYWLITIYEKVIK